MNPSDPVRNLLHLGIYTDIIHAISGEEHSTRDAPRFRKITVRTRGEAVKRKPDVAHAVQLKLSVEHPRNRRAVVQVDSSWPRLDF